MSSFIAVALALLLYEAIAGKRPGDNGVPAISIVVLVVIAVIWDAMRLSVWIHQVKR